MSVYLRKGRGWKYDFTLNGRRYTSSYFKTKAEAKRAEAVKKEEIRNPAPKTADQETETDMAFLELINRRLDFVKAYNSESHYEKYVQLARRWVNEWDGLRCGQLGQIDVERFVMKRAKVSAYTANQEIRYLRAVFNWGRKKGLVESNPVDGIDFLPVKRTVKYLPSALDIEKVIGVAAPEDQDYLYAIWHTMARVGEINNLLWSDIDLTNRFVILYTRKKKGGHMTPRKTPMTDRLFEIMSRRHRMRDQDLPWVFWRKSWSRKSNQWKIGPYKYRKKLMSKLCEKAGVLHFSFHALRHSGASIMDNSGVPLGSIQRILGHENRTTTEIYLHSIGNAEREAVAIFENSTKKSHPNSHPPKERRLRLVS